MCNNDYVNTIKGIDHIFYDLHLYNKFLFLQTQKFKRKTSRRKNSIIEKKNSRQGFDMVLGKIIEASVEPKHAALDWKYF